MKVNQMVEIKTILISPRCYKIMSSLDLKNSLSVAVGLRILTADTSPSRDHSNVVINSGLKSIKPIFQTNHRSSDSRHLDPCFLKSCFLCSKNLSLDKDVYMYRGDHGFCSEVCRDRQIYLDEIREIEKSTRQTLASFRCCRDSSNWCETKNLPVEFQQRQEQPMSCQKGPASIFTFS